MSTRMTKEQNDILFVCSLIEQIGRQTKNHRGDVVQTIGEKELRHQLNYADINHCLPLEQTADELTDKYNIHTGSYDTISKCRYTVPSVYDIGGVYAQLANDIAKKETPEAAIFQVFASFLSDAISDFNSAVYYQSSEYIKACYEEGEILD